MSIRQIFCLRFPNRQFECETMSLAGICWGMMVSSVFPYVFVLLRQRSKDIYSGFEVYLFMSGGFIYGQNAFRSVYICSSCFFDLL